MENSKDNVNRRLEELKGSDYKIVDEQPDIKGWSLYDAQHRKLGEVDDLLFDPAARKVRYIIADLDGNDLDMEEKEVLIPIGIAELHESEDEVILPNVTASQLNALPEYNDDRDLTDADENAIFAVFTGEGSAQYQAGYAAQSDPMAFQSGRTESQSSSAAAQSGSAAYNERYNHAHFDEQRFYRNRNKGANTARTEDNEVRGTGTDRDTRAERDSDRDFNDGIRK